MAKVAFFKKLIEKAGVDKGQNKGSCCRLSNMSAVKLSTTVFGQSLTTIGKRKKVLAVSEGCIW